MKKYFIFAAAALVSLAACSKVNTLEVTSLDENAIGFDAYSGIAVTKGTVETTADFDSIGVFAFYQPSASGYFNTKKYATPDFMYNQLVSKVDPATSWTYSPVKYWPNNSGDKLSFFAYAPYDELLTWEELGYATDINAKKLTVTFPVNSIVEDQVDYLAATPAINQSKPTVGTAISFAFNHVMSQINLFVAADTTNAGTNPTAWTDTLTAIKKSGTEITIDKIEFKDMAESVTITYPIDATDGKITTASIDTTASKSTQSILLTSETNFYADSLSSNSWKLNKYYKLNKESSVMFVAPQTLKKVVITYTVKTVDEKNHANDSEITNVISTPDDFSLVLKGGKAYNINFLIGMTSVKVSATVKDWEATTDTQVNVPKNK